MTTFSSSDTTTETYFDLAAALDRCCDDADFLAEMVDMLEGTVATQTVAIREAIQHTDPRALGESAHALKGAISSMTTATPYALARDLEQLGKNGECTGAEPLLAALQISLEQLLRETRHWAASR